MGKSKIAFFDFCETLVSFQTADAFVDYIRDKTHNRRMLKWNFIQEILRKLKIIQSLEIITNYKWSINKRLKLYQLKGININELNNWAAKYYIECIKPNFIKVVLDILLELRNNGYIIVIVSGGYDIYLKYFVREFKLQGLFCTRIKFESERCKGTIQGLDCLNTNKIKLLKTQYQIKDYYSIAFSDSQSDLPLLKWVDKGYGISKCKSQHWIRANNVNEIVWNEKKS